MDKEEYDKMFGINKYEPKTVTFKDSLINYLLKARPDYKRWRLQKLSKEQLYLISKSNNYI